jgi:hypothetical protein
MAVNTYVVNTTTTIAAGTAATVVAGEPGTGGAAGFGNAATSAGYDVKPLTFYRGQLIKLDPTGPLYTAIGAGNLTQVTRTAEAGTSGGQWGTSN